MIEVCECVETKVLETRKTAEGYFRRRRACLTCNARISTTEVSTEYLRLLENCYAASAKLVASVEKKAKGQNGKDAVVCSGLLGGG